MSKNHVYVRPPGNLLASEGRIHTPVSVPTMPHGHESHESQTSPPPTKGCRQPGQETVKNSVRTFFALKSGSACGPSTAFFSQKFSHNFSQCFSRLVPDHFFTIFFSHIFRIFFHCFSRTFFRTSDFAHFSYHIFQRCAAKRFFIVCSLCTA